MTLNEMPDFTEENEPAAFSPDNLLPGLDLS